MSWFLRSSLRWVILALFLLAFLWFVPQLQGEYFSKGIPDDKLPALVNEYRGTWAQIIGGFRILLGLYFTWRRVEISQQALVLRSSKVVDKRTPPMPPWFRGTTPNPRAGFAVQLPGGDSRG